MSPSSGPPEPSAAFGPNVVRPTGTSAPDALQDDSEVAHEPGALRKGLSWLPSLLVIVAFAAIAWVGHRNDWKLPKVAGSTGKDDLAWCESHGVAEDECIVCRPGLIEDSPELAFCTQHGVFGCVLCNPSIAETKTPTQPLASDLERAARALTLRHRKENLSIANSPGTRIQFSSLESMRKAGVDVEPVQRHQIIESVSAAGEILYDATKTAQVSPQADGIVRRVLVEVGNWVQPGQVLALIDSTEAGRLKTELIAAMADERLRDATVSRLRPIAGEAVAGRRLLESENDLQQARSMVDRTAAALGNLGIHVDLNELRRLDSVAVEAHVRRLGLGDVNVNTTAIDEVSKNLIAVTAPLGGQIVERSATIGKVVDRGSELFRVVDTRNVWLDLRVAEEDASLVRLGQIAHFTPDGQRRQHSGMITWISSDVDPQTRTVRVRAELANTDQTLRNESFGRGQVILREEADAIVVPQLAVQWDGSGQILFVRDARFFEADRPKFFVARSVRTGISQDGFVEVIAGVLPGEVVATEGSDVLRAQLLRSNLGAGCTCGH